MAKFNVGFSTKLFATMVIEADTEEEALEKARELRFDSSFANDVIEGFDSDYEGYRAKYWEIEVDGEASEDELAWGEE